MMINPNREYCYRVTHIDNLPMILQHGLVSSRHPKANSGFTSIGNPEIIGKRSEESVRIAGYETMGDYIPFYFTPRSIMLYNIVTGHRAPVVPKRNAKELVVIRCRIEDLAGLPQFFFTDGQGNDSVTKHYNDLEESDKVDWASIHASRFDKNDSDFDRPRRYQAEFLVHGEVPVSHIESLHVVDNATADKVRKILSSHQINLPVIVSPTYFFS